jgi:hypothetical protein
MLLGVSLYAALAVCRRHDVGATETVVVAVETIDALTRNWIRTAGRAPSPAEIDRLVQDHVDQELLFRAARAHGLHRSDALVRRRLIQNQRFVEVAKDGTPATDAERLESAYRLGLDQTDRVVRRRLIERMRQLLWADASQPEAVSFPNEPLLRLSHVFVSRDRNGAALNEAARRVQRELEEAGLEPHDAEVAALGDPLQLPRDLPPLTARRLASRLGAGFAAAVSELPTGRWSQPIPSSYGLHLVWLHERRPVAADAGEAPEPSESRHRAILEAALQRLRQGVDVIRYDRVAPP